MTVSNQGTEFTSAAVLAFAQETKLDWRFIAPGRPTQKVFVESFQGCMREECLNESLSFSLHHTCVIIAEWAEDDNTARPHLAQLSSPACRGNQLEPTRAITTAHSRRLRGDDPCPDCEQAQSSINDFSINWMKLWGQVTSCLEPIPAILG